MSTVDDAIVFDAVGRKIAESGSVVLQDVVAETGVSVGSLYHRYGSREGLLARAWLDAVLAFQTRFIAALESGEPDAGERAAVATPQFCRDEPARARLLICGRKEELLSAGSPLVIKIEVARANKIAAKSMAQFAKANRIPIDACRLGLVAFPLGAVRMYLPDQKVPKKVDAYVAAAFRSAVRVS